MRSSSSCFSRSAAGVADVATSRKRLELQAQQQLVDLGRQHAALQAQEEKLTSSAQRLQAKVEAFRTRKETIKATYTAAEAQIKMGEGFSGISEEMGDLGLAMQRAEDKTAQLQARAGAIDELLASGALDDASGAAQDPIQSELDAMSSGSDVELEMARLRAALLAGGPHPAITASEQDAATGPGQGRRRPLLPHTRPRRPMIVRILGEGQLEVPAGLMSELNEFDAALESAVEADDEPGLSRALAGLIARVRAHGMPVPDDMVLASEAILPPLDSTIAEVRALLGVDGLIPG